MRPLTEEETQLLFEKLSKYIGRNIKHLIDRSDAIYCFRLHKQFVYYVSEEVVKKATNVAGENLISLGTCFGKFTKSRKFQLQITALDCLAPFAKFKVWLKPTSELSFLYGARPPCHPAQLWLCHQFELGRAVLAQAGSLE